MVPLQTVPLAVRWVHLVALGVVLGGAVLLSIADEVPPELARRYEFGFWAAAGLLVLTGVSNVGFLAPAVPGPGTGWGATFTAKLLAVGSLIAFSVVRSVAVSRVAPTRGRALGSGWYVVTALWIAAIVALAVVMVRG